MAKRDARAARKRERLKDAKAERVGAPAMDQEPPVKERDTDIAEAPK